jgi:hydrogenase maturation protein HypF
MSDAGFPEEGPWVLGGVELKARCDTPGGNLSQHIALENLDTDLRTPIDHLLQILMWRQLIVRSRRLSEHPVGAASEDVCAWRCNIICSHWVIAESKISGPVLGLALDGTGYGWDGTIWGGEILRVDGDQCERLGHFRHLPLPGGNMAIRHPWRMALSCLWSLNPDGLESEYGSWHVGRA